MNAWPTFHVTITGGLIAGYAAVLSTITGVVQYFNYRRDRANIRVSARSGMEIIGDPRYKGKSLTIITVANLGRRPVTILTRLTGTQRMLLWAMR